MNNNLFIRGFTLIEVAIVVGFLTILALLVLPTYTNYLKKSQVVSGINLAASAKFAVAAHVTENKPLNSTWKPPAPNETVTNITVHLTPTTALSSATQGQVLTTVPAHQSGEIVITFSSKIAPAAHNELILSPRQPDPNRFSNDGHELPLDLNKQTSMLFITWECNSAEPPVINRGSRGSLDAKLVPADCRS